MDKQSDSFLDHTTQRLLDMDGSCAASSSGLVFTNWETLDLYQMVHHSPTDDCPHTPLPDDDIACDTYFTPGLPRHFEMGVSLYPTNKTVLETPMSPSGCDMLQDLGDSFASCPIPHYSVPEGSVWDLMTPSDGDAVWDLSDMDPEIRNISERVQLELLSLQEPPVSISHQAPSWSSENEQGSPSLRLATSHINAFRYPCRYSGCTRTFARKEDARRHYTTNHENINRRRLRYCMQGEFPGLIFKWCYN
ncbi:zinc finger odd-paired-like (opl) [Fusarium pseudocircinatum]|uniref:Zinc finger odd-paired-like (Opl) n=1 Tax=Fusarium pseudocircinatum TaxID=56676 RepID=A0A8H5KJ68_9HYPO|nr:zinc finger odd-paired-like (opl) [Fusarium pseudocircinatum]